MMGVSAGARGGVWGGGRARPEAFQGAREDAAEALRVSLQRLMQWPACGGGADRAPGTHRTPLCRRRRRGDGDGRRRHREVQPQPPVPIPQLAHWQVRAPTHLRCLGCQSRPGLLKLCGAALSPAPSGSPAGNCFAHSPAAPRALSPRRRRRSSTRASTSMRCRSVGGGGVGSQRSAAASASALGRAQGAAEHNTPTRQHTAAHCTPLATPAPPEPRVPRDRERV